MKITHNDQFSKQFLVSWNQETRSVMWSPDEERAYDFTDSEVAEVIEWLTEELELNVRTE